VADGLEASRCDEKRRQRDAPGQPRCGVARVNRKKGGCDAAGERQREQRDQERGIGHSCLLLPSLAGRVALGRSIACVSPANARRAVKSPTSRNMMLGRSLSNARGATAKNAAPAGRFTKKRRICRASSCFLRADRVAPFAGREER